MQIGDKQGGLSYKFIWAPLSLTMEFDSSYKSMRYNTVYVSYCAPKRRRRKFWAFVTSLQWIPQWKQRQIMIKITTITEFDSPIYKKAPLVTDRGQTRGGFLIKGGFLNNNSTDEHDPSSLSCFPNTKTLKKMFCSWILMVFVIGARLALPEFRPKKSVHLQLPANRSRGSQSRIQNFFCFYTSS